MANFASYGCLCESMPPIQVPPLGYGKKIAIEIDVPPNVCHYQVAAILTLWRCLWLHKGRGGNGCITSICITSSAMSCIAIPN